MEEELSGEKNEHQHGGQQGEAGPREAPATRSVLRQVRLRRLVQRIIWGTIRRQCEKQLTLTLLPTGGSVSDRTKETLPTVEPKSQLEQRLTAGSDVNLQLQTRFSCQVWMRGCCGDGDRGVVMVTACHGSADGRYSQM